MKQFLSYTGIGILSTAVEYLSYLSVLYLMKGSPWDMYCGVVAGFFLSVLFSFLCNQSWVFCCEEDEERNFFLALLKTYLMYFVTGILLKEALLWLFVEKLLVSKYIAPLVLVALISPLNFTISKFWAYKPKKRNPEIDHQEEPT